MKAKQDHINRVEAGDSSEDDAYWEAKADLDAEKSVSPFAPQDGHSSLESKSVSSDALSGKPAYFPTRQHMETLLSSEVTRSRSSCDGLLVFCNCWSFCSTSAWIPLISFLEYSGAFRTPLLRLCPSIWRTWCLKKSAMRICSVADWFRGICVRSTRLSASCAQILADLIVVNGSRTDSRGWVVSVCSQDPGCVLLDHQNPMICMQEHVLFSCPMRPKPCAHGCGQLLKDEDKMVHENDDCPFR
jgi:hypothetical protein